MTNNMMTSYGDECDDDSLLGDLAPYNEAARRRNSIESISSITFEGSYESVFGDTKNNKSSSSNLCYSRWESLGDSNSNIIGLFDRGEAVNNTLPSVIFISGGEAAATMQQRAVMTITMPQRQQTSHIRKPPLRRVSSSGTLSFGGSLRESNDKEEKQQQQIALPPRPAMATIKGAASDKSGFGLATAASSHTFASYALGPSNHTPSSYSRGPSNHTFATYSKGPSSHTFATYSKGLPNHTFAHASNHTFASFASSTSHSSAAGILSTCESVEENNLQENSTVASFSSDTATSRASSKQSSHLKVMTPRHRLRRESIGNASSCRIDSVAQ